MVRTTGQSDYGSEQDNRYELIILRIKCLRNMLIFVSRYLKFLVSEEICGRFGFVSTNGRLHINVPRLWPMMECQLHCL